MKNFQLLLFLPLLSVSSSGKDVTMSLQGSDLCPTASLIRELQDRSRVQCMGICLSEHTCSGVCHNAKQRICRTFSSFVSEAKTDAGVAPGFNMYWLEYLDGYSRFGQKAYKYFTQLQTNANALLRCQGMNATLALPMNPDEGRDILMVAIGGNVWIDLNDELNEDNWVSRRTGKPVSNIDWLAGQPAGGSLENCGFIDGVSKIEDYACSFSMTYVCERLVYGSY